VTNQQRFFIRFFSTASSPLEFKKRLIRFIRNVKGDAVAAAPNSNSKDERSVASAVAQ
jgi:hypothetical protein